MVSGTYCRGCFNLEAELEILQAVLDHKDETIKDLEEQLSGFIGMGQGN